MKQEIESNYRQINLDIVLIIGKELERIKNDPVFTAFGAKGMIYILRS